MNIPVSVILPSLNVEPYIEQCIQSAIHQTLQNIEIICIDAGSTDGTLDILEKYKKIDSRIILLHSDVKSYGYQVNKGIDIARGEYIAVLETDDYVSEDMYELLYHKAKENDLDVAKCNYVFREDYEDGIDYRPWYMKPQEDSLYQGVHHVVDRPELFQCDINIWRGLYKKSFLKRNHILLNNSKGAAYQDEGFGLQVLLSNPRIGYIYKPCYYYRFAREGSSTWNRNILAYVYQEWKMLKNRGILSRDNSLVSHALARLVNAFVGEYNKLLEMVDFDIDSEYIKPYFNWICGEAQDALRTYPVIEKEIDRDSVNWIINDNNSYVEEYKEKICKKRNNDSRIISICNKLPVIIFGCGNYGRAVKNILWNVGIRKILFCDSNEEKWGSCVDDIIVKSPQKVFAVHNGTVIIANKNHYSEIYKQVVELASDECEIVDANVIFDILKQ